MRTSTLLLSVLITMRLLMPPGICVCKLSSPASRLLAAAVGNELPPALPENDDDHDPGCPASCLAPGLGVAPPTGPGPIPCLLLIGVFWFSPAVMHCTGDACLETTSLSLPWNIPIATAPLYVSQCALLF